MSEPRERTLESALSDDSSGPSKGLVTGTRTANKSGPPAEIPRSFDGLPVVPRDRYSVLEEVGRGGQGRVVRARDTRLLRTVALKESLHDDPASLTRFAREAFITARLEHPSIVPVHEAGRWASGEPFYAMKSVSGTALDALITRAKSFEERIALLPNVARVAEALAYAHNSRVIHRDLKPSNVLIGEFGETIVIDWGLAKELGGPDLKRPDATVEAALDPEAGPTNATVAGDIVGTPAYMPPEQARGDEVDERADVYALGAMLYHLVAGSAPFALRKGFARSVLRGPPDPLEKLEPRVPRDLLAVIDKAMARDAAQRYETAGALADDLGKFLAGRLVGAHRYSPWQLVVRWASRHRAAIGGTVLVLVLLLAFGAASVTRILHERDVANHARLATELAEKRAADRSQALVLLQARAQLDRDPTASLAWLKTYPPGAPDWAAASEIASDALARGVAKRVWLGDAPFASIAFAPDGRYVVAGSRTPALDLWNLGEGNGRAGARRHLTSDVELGGPVVVSPDGQWIASSNGRKAVRVWEVASDARRAFDGIDAARLDFSADSHLLLVAGALGGATVVDLPSGALRPLAAGGKPIVASTFVPGEHTVAAIDADSLWLIDPDTGQRKTVGPLGAKPHAVAVSPDKRWIVVSTPERSLVVYDQRTGKRRELVASTPWLTSHLRFSPEGLLVTWGTVSGLLRWDLERGEAQNCSFPDMIQTLEFTRQGTILISGQNNGLVEWDPEANVGVPLSGHSATVTAVAVLADGRWLATASADKSVRLWATRTEEKVFRSLNGSDLSRDGRTILGFQDFAACTVDVATGTTRTISKPRTWFTGTSGAISPDGQSVVISGGEHDIVLVDLPSGAKRTLLRYEGAAALDLAESFSPDGKSIAIAMNTGTVDLLDVATGAVRTLGRHEGKVLSVAFAPDGQSVASGGRDNAVRVWNVATGDGRTLWGHGAAIYRVAYSRDGQRLASSSDDGTIRVWNVETGESRTLEGHTAQVYGVDFDPSGTHVVSASGDRTVRIWDLASGESRIVRRGGSSMLSARFTDDGSSLVAFSDDITVSIWKAHVAEVFGKDPTDLRARLDAGTSAGVDEKGKFLSVRD
jgi:WD40 repeat protein/tRNA A-37 threonylcarbamoyl transferase component Bud32